MKNALSFCLILLFLPLFAQAEIDIFANPEKDVQLSVGSRAPKLSDVFWLRQEPKELFAETDKVYFIEFWGTWCGPCIASIPHLNEIAKKYADRVSVVGIAASEQGTHRAERLQALSDFLADPNSPQQEYPIAYGSPSVKQRWLKASWARGIPRTYLVKNGIVMWEGHPMESEEVLEKILANNWDLSEARIQDLATKKEIVALARLEQALKTSAPNAQKLKWVQRYLNEYTDDLSVRIIELDLLAQMEAEQQDFFAQRVRDLFAIDDLGGLFYVLGRVRSNDRLKHLEVQAADQVIRLISKNPPLWERIMPYGHYYFKDLVEILTEQRRTDEAIEYLNLALDALEASEQKDSPMKDAWQRRANVLERATAAIKSPPTAPLCVDGVCDVPAISTPAPTDNCEETLSRDSAKGA